MVNEVPLRAIKEHADDASEASRQFCFRADRALAAEFDQFMASRTTGGIGPRCSDVLRHLLSLGLRTAKAATK